ncbi:MAG: DUF445 family protein [Acidimicrobiales bacterium]
MIERGEQLARTARSSRGAGLVEHAVVTGEVRHDLGGRGPRVRAAPAARRGAGRRRQLDRRRPSLQAKIDDWVSGATGYVAEQFRDEVAGLIATTVQRWDTQETAERLELQVGRDLQFIRINGTVVGASPAS